VYPSFLYLLLEFYSHKIMSRFVVVAHIRSPYWHFFAVVFVVCLFVFKKPTLVL